MNVAGEGIHTILMEKLKAKYSNLHYLDEFQGLWRKDSKWFLESKRLNGGVPVGLDRWVHARAGRQGRAVLLRLKGRKKKVEVLW